MATYLEQHPPKVRQFRTPRRAVPSGLIVVHTAESIMDTVGPDTGAENVAAFIANRSDYGSYHTLVDSDTRVRLVPFHAEAYGDGTGSNPFAIHISFALKTTDWTKLSAERKRAFIRNGALAAAEAAEWVRAEHKIAVPARRVTRRESDARVPGFISHAERDPARRSDPGIEFPWAMFLAEFAKAMRADEVAAADQDLRGELTDAAQAAKHRPKLRERIQMIRDRIGKPRR
jgi:hypothetical protein